jgi:chromate transporter
VAYSRHDDVRISRLADQAGLMAGYGQLGWIFLRIGAVAFGGLGATVALLEEELTRRRALASHERIADALTYTKLLPGSTAVQVVAYLGWWIGGWTGALVSTAAFLLPSVALMLAFAYGYSLLPELPWIVSVRRGVIAAVVALLLLTVFRLGRSALIGPMAIIVAVAAFATGASSHAHAAWIVVVAGLAGALGRQR